VNRLPISSCSWPASRFDNNAFRFEDGVEAIETGLQFGPHSLEVFGAVVTVFHFVLFQRPIAAGPWRRRQRRHGSNRTGEDAHGPGPPFGCAKVAGRGRHGPGEGYVLVDHQHELVLQRVDPCRRPRRPVLISRHAQRLADQRTPAGKSQLQIHNWLIFWYFIDRTRL